MTNLETLVDKGYVYVAEKREGKPVKLYYEQHGKGPEKVLLVTGLNSPCYTWDKQVAFLAGTGDFTVIIFDNRGMGHSDSPWGAYATSQLAMDALELLDQMGWDTDVHLVGISMGGMISLEMATAVPERFKTLTLTSTTARRNWPTWKALWALSRIALWYTEPRDKINTAIELVYPLQWLEAEAIGRQDKTNRQIVIAQMIERVTRSRIQPLRGNLGQSIACLRHYVSDDRLRALKSTGLPIMIVTGTWDNLVAPQSSFHMHEILEARFELFDGCGHAVPQEQEERYNGLLLSHFGSAPSIKNKL